MTADAVGGVWTYALDLVGGLRAHGVEVILAVLGPAPAEASAVVDLRMLDLPLDWTAEAPEAVLAAGEAVAALARREAVDLVHLNGPALAAGGAFEGPVLGVCHSDVATWWSAVKSGPLPADLAWRADQAAAGYRACDLLLAPSRAFADATAATFGVAAPNVVYNGRSGGPRASGAHHAQGAPYVFACGRLWDEGKNIATLDRAAARLKAPVLAAGPTHGPNGAAVALSHIQALGSLSSAQVTAHQAGCAVFVAPSLYEPFGLAVLEAAQLARPLVLADIPTFRELWDGAAVFFPPRDADALADAIDGLLADPAERARLGAAAADRAARYTTEAMVAGTLAAYRRLVETNGTRNGTVGTPESGQRDPPHERAA